MPLTEMLADLPTQCDIGGKKNSQGNTEYWRGYKLHLDVADGQIPISAVLTSASVHDSQVAIPLATMTTQRVTYCYAVMDSAYDAYHIKEQSRVLGHVPIVDPKTPPQPKGQTIPLGPAAASVELGGRGTIQRADDGGTGQRAFEGRVRRPVRARAGSGQGNGTSDVRGGGANGGPDSETGEIEFGEYFTM